MDDAYEEEGTSESVCGVVASPKEGQRGRRYVVYEQAGRSFQRYWQGGFEAPVRAQYRAKDRNIRYKS